MNQSDVDTLISQVHTTNAELDARTELGKLLREIQEDFLHNPLDPFIPGGAGDEWIKGSVHWDPKGRPLSSETLVILRKFEALTKACGEEELFLRRMREWGLSEDDIKAPS
jgi:hypothetical protein